MEQIKTSLYDEIDFKIYDTVQKAHEIIKELEKKFKELNIPLSFIMIPKNIDDVESYSLRRFYIDNACRSLQASSRCEKDLDLSEALKHIEKEKLPMTDEEIEYERKSINRKVVAEVFE